MSRYLKKQLEVLYEKYNQKRYIDPDPLLFVHQYPDKENRELVGFIAACFAYGRVEMIMKTVQSILEQLGPDPKEFLIQSEKADLSRRFKGFRYRFANQVHLVDLLLGLKGVFQRFGCLEDCFNAGMNNGDETVLSGLTFLSDEIRGTNDIGHLLANPHKHSACKRSHLFLRWMVRKDRVDPGCWGSVAASKLIIPLDRHMHAAGNILGFTTRKSADFKTAMEITRGFQKLVSHDPVKYDFSLTRFGIRRELTMDTLKCIVC